MSSFTFAHLGEYLFVCSFHTNELKWDSFLLNQSNAYVIAAVFSWAEFLLGFYKPEWLKVSCLIFGLPMILIGHYCRIGAMFTA
jgi:hypothetical protein